MGREISLFENGDGIVVGVKESDRSGVGDAVLLGIVNGENNGHWHIRHRPIREPEGIEMKRLEELGFSHESGERAGPAFAEHMNPLDIDAGELDTGQG